jgi:hypothetical protein
MCDQILCDIVVRQSLGSCVFLRDDSDFGRSVMFGVSVCFFFGITFVLASILA